MKKAEGARVSWGARHRHSWLCVVAVLLAGVSNAQNEDVGPTEAASTRAEELRVLLKSGRLDEAVELVKSLDPGAPEAVQCTTIIRADRGYLSRSRARSAFEVAALAAAKKGQIDVSRFKLEAAEALPVVGASLKEDVDAAIAALPSVELPVPPPRARSSMMELSKFLGEWQRIVDGSDELKPELAQYALDIRRENVCESGGNAFERDDCEKFQKQLRSAITKGLESRLLVLRNTVGADFDIPRKRWKVSVNTTIRSSMWDPRFFKSQPQMCELGPCLGLCQEDVGGIEFAVPMSPDDARAIIDDYPRQLRSVVLVKLGADGVRSIPMCSRPEVRPVHYNLYTVVGALVLAPDGKALFSSGLFK